MNIPGAIEQDVESAQVGGSRANRVGVGDVEEAGGDAGNPVELAQPLLVDIRGDDPRALGSEGLGRGPTDALGSRGYQGPLFHQSFGHSPSRRHRGEREVWASVRVRRKKRRTRDPALTGTLNLACSNFAYHASQHVRRRAQSGPATGP